LVIGHVIPQVNIYVDVSKLSVLNPCQNKTNIDKKAKIPNENIDKSYIYIWLQVRLVSK